MSDRISIRLDDGFQGKVMGILNESLSFTDVRVNYEVYAYDGKILVKDKDNLPLYRGDWVRLSRKYGFYEINEYYSNDRWISTEKMSNKRDRSGNYFKKTWQFEVVYVFSIFDIRLDDMIDDYNLRQSYYKFNIVLTNMRHSETQYIGETQNYVGFSNLPKNIKDIFDNITDRGELSDFLSSKWDSDAMGLYFNLILTRNDIIIVNYEIQITYKNIRDVYLHEDSGAIKDFIDLDRSIYSKIPKQIKWYNFVEPPYFIDIKIWGPLLDLKPGILGFNAMVVDNKLKINLGPFTKLNDIPWYLSNMLLLSRGVIEDNLSKSDNDSLVWIEFSLQETFKFLNEREIERDVFKYTNQYRVGDILKYFEDNDIESFRRLGLK
jgi:hypothetical protein